MYYGKKLTAKEEAKVNRSIPGTPLDVIMKEHEEAEKKLVSKIRPRSDKGVKRAKYNSSIPLRMRSYIGRANKKGISFDLTIEQFDSIRSGRCVYCGISNKIGIDRIDSSIGYTIDNCQPCCAQCNFMKFSYTEDQFLKQVLNIYRHRLA